MGLGVVVVLDNAQQTQPARLGLIADTGVRRKVVEQLDHHLLRLAASQAVLKAQDRLLVRPGSSVWKQPVMVEASSPSGRSSVAAAPTAGTLRNARERADEGACDRLGELR